MKSTDDDPRIIGKPINCHAWIVDSGDHNQLAGIGCIGELVIDGPTLSKGYLTDPQKTEAAYMCDPPWTSVIEGKSTHSRRFYKTGDLVKYTDDGRLIFMGRKDSQVKINGQRVEIGDIEHQISLLLNEITNVTVEFIDDISDGTAIRLGAAISFRDTESLSNDTPHTKLAYLKSTLPIVLPSHMVPSLLLHVDQTPLNYAGKTDRRQIRSLLRAARETKNTDQRTPPSSAQELELQPLWEKVLGYAAGTACIEDEFFSRGDSISAIRLASAARKVGLELSAADIFRKREFGPIARCLRQLSTISDGLVQGSNQCNDYTSTLNRVHALYNINEDDIEAIYPCLDTQEHLMRESLSNPGSNVMRITYALDDAIDLDTFKRAWKLVAAATEILRTRIVEMVDADMVQLLLKSEFAWEDATDLDTYLIQDTDRPLQLGLPLTRYALVRSHKSTLFVWTIHHALYDDWSLPLLLSRVEATYSSLLSDKSTSLDHASLRRLVEHRMARDAAAESHFWTSELSGATVGTYPSTKRLELPRSTDYLERSISISKTCIEPEYATANLIRAAWAIVLAHNSSTADVTYGTFLAARSAPVEDIEQMIGPVLAKIPVRVRIEQGMTARALLSSTWEHAMCMSARQHMGMHRIAELGTSCKNACHFQTMLVIHPSETNGMFESQMGMRKVHVSGHHPHELVIEAVLSNDDSVQLKASWDKRALSIEQVGTLLGQIEGVITSLSSESLSNIFVQDSV